MNESVWRRKLRWMYVYRFVPTEIDIYRLIDRGDKHNQYLSSFDFCKVRDCFNPHGIERTMMRDKAVFDAHFRNLGFALPDLIGIIDLQSEGGMAIKKLTDCLVGHISGRETRSVDAVFKNSGGSHGDLVRFVDNCVVEDGVCYGVFRGRMVEIGQWLQSEFELCSGRVLVQEKVDQHELLARLHRTSLNTLRVVTYKSESGDVVVDKVVLRIGTGGSRIDSWRRGGIAAEVNLDTAVVGEGIRISGEPAGGTWYSHHPDTGERFAGTIIPYLCDAIAIACSAAASLRENRWVGWDIAISMQGPVIIEVNRGWAIPIMLVHSQGVIPVAWHSRVHEALPDRGSEGFLRRFFRFLVFITSRLTNKSFVIAAGAP